ncbi:MAG: hypothetical protein EOP88_03140 [Verrucomicrobiaceae bacterium]|nr:MAG: hypothetical protein EOP88_03140 [Verrucomicrobiaceae bacterium]
MKTRFNTLLLLTGTLAAGFLSSCTYVEPTTVEPATTRATTTTTTRSVDPYAGSATIEKRTTTTQY